jgi:hypothetical protein
MLPSQSIYGSLGFIFLRSIAARPIGSTALRWGTNAIYNQGGETAGYQSFMGYDPANKITLIVWTNLTI